jgi:hypothetical protein
MYHADSTKRTSLQKRPRGVSTSLYEYLHVEGPEVSGLHLKAPAYIPMMPTGLPALQALHDAQVDQETLPFLQFE